MAQYAANTNVTAERSRGEIEKTVGDWALPQVAQAYDMGEMPKALPMPSDS